MKNHALLLSVLAGALFFMDQHATLTAAQVCSCAGCANKRVHEEAEDSSADDWSIAFSYSMKDEEAADEDADDNVVFGCQIDVQQLMDDTEEQEKSANALGFSRTASVQVVETPSAGDAFFFRNRWTITATDGTVANVQGTPVTLTWNFVPDGTGIEIPAAPGAESTLIDFLDDVSGNLGDAAIDHDNLSQKSWFPNVAAAYARWDELCGLTFVYEPADDGADLLSSVATRGELGVRADMRVAGASLSAAAVNTFPNGGDGIISTDAARFFSNRDMLRNVLAHEVGHGLGIPHIESQDAVFLMNPTGIRDIDGPQLSDILAVQRGYGDALESGAGNDTAALSTAIGAFEVGDSFAIGTDADASAALVPVVPPQNDFVSIDGANDVDYFSFTVNEPSRLNATLTQVGAVFISRPQSTTAIFTEVDTRQLAFLDLEIVEVEAGGVTTTRAISGSAVDFAESINSLMLSPGVQYAALVRNSSDAFDNVQLYRLDLNFVAPPLVGDFDVDEDVDADDVDFYGLVPFGTPVFGELERLDLNGDGFITLADHDLHVTTLVQTSNGQTGAMIGDVNLDGVVDVLGDAFILVANLGSSVGGYANGDLNADRVVDVLGDAFRLIGNLGLTNDSGS